MNSFWTVVRFTYLNRFRSKAFLVTSIIFAVLISVGVNLPSIIDAFSSSDKAVKVGMFESSTGIPAKLDEYFKKQEKPKVEILTFPDQGSKDTNDKFITGKVTSKEIKGFLEADTSASAAGFPAYTYKSEGSIMQQGTQNDLVPALQTVKQEMAIADAKLSQEQLNKLFAPVKVDSVQIKSGAQAGKSQSQMIVSYILVYALLILFFVVVQMYGNLIATEITSEKSSRVMELLISSVSPLRQMFGKVFGMFLLGLTQIAVFVVIALVNLNLPNNSSFFRDMHLDFSDTPVSLYLYGIIFYLLGFFLFAMLYASIGSLVSRTEDLGQAVMPVTMLALASFYIGIFGINNPTAGFITVMSFIPFFTPLVMFLRIGMTEPAVWEIWLSIGILIVTILLVGWLSAKIYRTGVLMYGKKPSIKEVLKAMRAYRV